MKKDASWKTLAVIIGVLTAVAAAAAACAVYLGKKKADDEALDDYLENCIQ